MNIDMSLTADALRSAAMQVFETAATAAKALSSRWSAGDGSPVFTEAGRYTSRGWTEWTQGFQFGIPLLVSEVTGDTELLEYGRRATTVQMAPHLTHTGVHDHGFNNISTYGTLLRQIGDGTITADRGEIEFYRIALKVSGAVQASRWTPLPQSLGYVCSFNGPHSLFADTIRSMRSLAVSHALGHALMEEQDNRVSLLGRLLIHAETTARYNVYFGNGRDLYDIRGRVAHESIFNVASGAYRCPSSQQGYSPFTTWTRGQAWILCGYAEQLEFIATCSDEEIRESSGGLFVSRGQVLDRFVEVATAVADHYLENTPTDGVPYWDTGAPGLVHLGDYLVKPSDPFNPYEPVDSSAAAIAAQGLLRLGSYLTSTGVPVGTRYTQAGLTIAKTLFDDPYLSRDSNHEGTLLHSIYHRPNGWDHVSPGNQIPNGESSMWGDYHAVELALCLDRLAKGAPMHRFFDLVTPDIHETEAHQ